MGSILGGAGGAVFRSSAWVNARRARTDLRQIASERLAQGGFTRRSGHKEVTISAKYSFNKNSFWRINGQFSQEDRNWVSVHTNFSGPQAQPGEQQ
jgi:hypothetical protein